MNETLKRHASWLLSGGPHRVLVPFCGKTHDLAWIAGQGHHVLGVEVSPIAVEALFKREGWAVEPVALDGALVWTAGPVTVVCGDLFTLPSGLIEPCDRLWDRAALVALPASMRRTYVRCVRARLVADALGLVCTLESVPEDRGGPPFTVREQEVLEHYAGARVSSEPTEQPEPETYLSRGYDALRTFTYRIEGCGQVDQFSS